MITLIFFLMSLLNVSHIETPWMWKLSIVTSELGYLFAILVIFYSIYYMYRRLPSPAIVLQILSVCFFLYPLFSGIRYQPAAMAQLQKAGVQAPTNLISFSNFMFGWGFERTPPQKIVYDQANQLPADFYRATCKGPCSFVVVVHGGGWDSGDAKQLQDLNWVLSERGFAVFSIEYQLAPEHQWPAQKNNLLAAIAYIKANAEQFGIDPHRLAVLGRSAGSQIAGDVAYSSQDPDIKAYVNFYGPTDMVFGYEVADVDDIIHSRKLLENYFGGTPMQKLTSYQDASLFPFITKDSPPTLTFHGGRDPLCWYKHAERLANRLDLAGVPNATMILPWATHGFDFILRGPGGQTSTESILLFFDKYLR